MGSITPTRRQQTTAVIVTACVCVVTRARNLIRTLKGLNTAWVRVRSRGSVRSTLPPTAAFTRLSQTTECSVLPAVQRSARRESRRRAFAESRLTADAGPGAAWVGNICDRCPDSAPGQAPLRDVLRAKAFTDSRQIRSIYDSGATTPGSARWLDVAAATNSHQPVGDATTGRRLPRYSISTDAWGSVRPQAATRRGDHDDPASPALPLPISFQCPAASRSYWSRPMSAPSPLVSTSAAATSPDDATARVTA